MRANFALSGAATGVRRNLTMTIFFVISTTIALTFAGAALLANQEVTRFRTEYEYGRGHDPAGARGLSGFVARASREHTTAAVAGYDLTFSPVKSVSALWAIALRDSGDDRGGPRGRRYAALD